MRPALWLTALFLIGPLFIVVLFSFNESETSPSVTGLSLRWYEKALADSDFQRGLANSLVVSLGTTLLSGLIGVSAALAARLSPSRWARRLLATACVVPLLTPELLIAVGTAAIFNQVGLPRSLGAVIIGHTSFGVPLFFLLTDSALSGGRFDELIRAARDLGASGASAVRRIVLPLLWPYIVSSAVLIWALSIDEVVMAFFLSGNEQVLTVRLFSLMRTKGISAEINVACVILMLLVVSIWVSGNWVRRKFTKELS